MTIGFKRLIGVFAFAGATALTGWFATPSADATEAIRHLALLRSSPVADAVLQSSPREVRLVFSEAPQIASSSIRLTRGEETLVPSTEAAPDSTDAKQLVIRPTRALASGSYMVHWRVMSRDGHTVRGTYGFRVGSSPD